MNVVKALRERHKWIEIFRKQMRMTKRCSKEPDVLFGLIGIDYSKLELCPIPIEIDTEKQIEEKWR